MSLLILIPLGLIAFGCWRFYKMARVGLFEGLIGFAILLVCLIVSGSFLIGALACARYC